MIMTLLSDCETNIADDAAQFLTDETPSLEE